MYLIFTTLLALVIVTITVYSGVYLIKNNTDSSKYKIKKALRLNLSTFIPVMLMIFVLLLPHSSMAVSNVASTTQTAVGDGLKYIGAALSTGFATIGTGIAVGSVGQAAIGAISEDQSILGKTIIFVGLAEGIAIFGVIISILILFA